jgi:hypothetical protein
MLHVTNGHSVIESFRKGAIPGEYLSWDDPLHDGPVPLTATLGELQDASRPGAGANASVPSSAADWGKCARLDSNQ